MRYDFLFFFSEMRIYILFIGTFGQRGQAQGDIRSSNLTESGKQDVVQE